MNENFKVGEILIGQNARFLTQYNGRECMVTGGLEMRTGRMPGTLSPLDTSMKYEVMWSDGQVTVADPHQLRRKQPPFGELSILNMFVVAPPNGTKEPA